MSTNEKKRYLVTYTDGSVSSEKATSILGVNKNRMMEGMSFMASESIPKKDDVLHFESLGISSLSLSATEADDISHLKGILAVEEDLEVFALGSINDEKQFNELFLNSGDIAEETESAPGSDFHKGYNQALTDVFGNLLKTGNIPNLHGVSVPKGAAISKAAKVKLQPTAWNISMVKAPKAWARGIDGKGVNVAVLDTGVAQHPDLVISGGACFIPGKSSFNDLQGHGTHCAGIVSARSNSIGVIGVAPKSNLYAVKVLDDNGSGMTSWIIAGMEWCIKNKIKVASMSLGGTGDPMVAYSNAVKRCQDNGVTVVTASGNSYGTAFPWVCAPANSIMEGALNASPIAVGAVNNMGMIGDFSSRGGRTKFWNYVNCVAPGVGINSTYLKKKYKPLTGTSMACPHVAGLAALIVQRYPGISPVNVKRRIATTCTDLGSREFDVTYGFGLIDCDKATR